MLHTCTATYLTMHSYWIFSYMTLLALKMSNFLQRNKSIYSISQEICTRFFAFLCFVVVIHWLIFPYPSGLLHWHCGNLTIAPVPAKQPWWIWINTSCEFIKNVCIATTKQSTTKPCAYFLGYTVPSYVLFDFFFNKASNIGCRSINLYCTVFVGILL